MFQKPSLVAERQAPLRRTYVEDPAKAHTVKWAATTGGGGNRRPKLSDDILEAAAATFGRG
jgi:hypothetical protein